MNTLAKSTTASILSPEQRDALCIQWRTILAERIPVTAAHQLLYMALLGRDWRTAFTPISNATKLANGGFNDWELFRSLLQLHTPYCTPGLLKPFGGLVDETMLTNLRRLISFVNKRSYGPSAYSRGVFPFDAYTMPAQEVAGAA